MSLSAHLFDRRRPIPTYESVDLSNERHRDEFLDPGQPYIVRNVVPSRAMSWTSRTLRERIGHTSATCFVSEDGIFLFGNDAGLDPFVEPTQRSVAYGRYHAFTLTLAEAIDRLEGCRTIPLVSHGEKLYWYGRVLPRALWPDVHPLPSFIADKMGPPALWMSQAGALTTMHYDSAPGFLLQIRGCKRISLLPSDVRLPEFAIHDARARQVLPIDWEERIAADPSLAASECWESILGPGDAVFLPSFVWHQVESLDDSLSVSIATIIPEIDECIDAIARLFGPSGPVLRTPPSVRQALFQQLLRSHRGGSP